jgi:hypothetical protein
MCVRVDVYVFSVSVCTCGCACVCNVCRLGGVVVTKLVPVLTTN